ILVPAALLMSSLIPWLIMPLLLLGGLFLCFEGAEKILETFFHSYDSHQPSSEEVELGSTSIEEYEKRKIAGAIRTDFILSAEIIVIALGTVQGHDMITQILVVSLIAVIMTIGVYGLVAAIVKLDDLGFYLERISNGSGLKFRLGKGLISFAPKLMKGLTIVGTAAMFLVGGGIVVHNVPWVHHALEPIVSALPNLSLLTALVPVVLNGVVGLLAGLAVAAVWSIANQLRPSR
ncbi:DUF808 family protein, partial [Vibrio aestuarianus]